MTWLRRTLTFTRFALTEYSRSARILVEVLALIAMFWLFFWPRSQNHPDMHQFFNLSGIFILALGLYTSSALTGLALRPQNYIILARPLGRRGFLFGLFIASITISLSIFLVLSLMVVLINRPVDLTAASWLQGTLPLLLDIMIISAFMLLVSPLVMGPGTRLGVLAVLALAFSADLLATGALADAAAALHTIVSLPLFPVMGGFELAVTRNYANGGTAIIVSQLLLIAALLAFAVSSFDRHELKLVA